VRVARANPETRERLYDAAQRLMLEKGFPATSVDEICAAAGVTKGSFFHYFTSKEHLGRELLERYLAVRMEEQASLAAEPDPLKRLYDFLDDAIARSEAPHARRGCLMGTFAQELSATNPEIGRLCAAAFRTWTDNLRRDLADAKALYAPHADFEPQSLADHFAAVMEGALILAKVNLDTHVVEESLKHFRSYLGMLFGQV
jgi:TetR/AcrR family transcriptional regulator, transcriptional repressor for nem operon